MDDEIVIGLNIVDAEVQLLRMLNSGEFVDEYLIFYNSTDDGVDFIMTDRRRVYVGKDGLDLVGKTFSKFYVNKNLDSGMLYDAIDNAFDIGIKNNDKPNRIKFFDNNDNVLDIE